MKVAITGPTGEIGRALLRALDREPGVELVVGIARGEFDPVAAGFSDKVRYERGELLDPDPNCSPASVVYASSVAAVADRRSPADCQGELLDLVSHRSGAAVRDVAG